MREAAGDVLVLTCVKLCGGVDDALRARCRLAALNAVLDPRAPAVPLFDVFGDAEELLHGWEDIAQPVEIEASDDDLTTVPNELDGYIGEVGVEELGFVHTNDFCLVIHELEDLRRGFDRDGVEHEAGT